jgi:anthranilate/para-aminobenzoate synthase component I
MSSPVIGVSSRNIDASIVSRTANVQRSFLEGRISIDASAGVVHASNDLLPSIKEIASRSAVKTTAKSQRNNQ